MYVPFLTFSSPLLLLVEPPTEESIRKYEEILYQKASRTQTPCLLVRGRNTDMVSPETAQLFVSKMPNAQYVDVADAAHMVVGDKNDIFAAQTLAFLRKHLPSSHSNL